MTRKEITMLLYICSIIILGKLLNTFYEAYFTHTCKMCLVKKVCVATGKEF